MVNVSITSLMNEFGPISGLARGSIEDYDNSFWY
jgi:hypothetical protein